uniref:Uncharacterized protein n=1 Tax=Zea mays TaxID=4577 RepID=C0PP11_MAIZE|nr:unknown [Zea mays]
MKGGFVMPMRSNVLRSTGCSATIVFNKFGRLYRYPVHKHRYLRYWLLNQISRTLGVSSSGSIASQQTYFEYIQAVNSIASQMSTSMLCFTVCAGTQASNINRKNLNKLVLSYVLISHKSAPSGSSMIAYPNAES